MTGDDDEKRKVKRKLYILDFLVIHQRVVPFSRDIEPFYSFICISLFFSRDSNFFL